MALTSGLTELSFSASTLTVNRGTYNAAVCVNPGSGNSFVGDSTYTLSTSGFATYPATFSAY